jgi:hypothetical protein
VRVHRVVLVASMAGLLGAAAFAPAAGCNGTGVTPTCDFPDGATNPESGCGELVEAAPPPDSPIVEVDVVEEPGPTPGDAGNDSTSPGDSGGDAPEDTKDSTPPKDVEDDVKDANPDHKD